jgi:hypothetical protein
MGSETAVVTLLVDKDAELDAVIDADATRGLGAKVEIAH